jgi:hypothetical protein
MEGEAAQVLVATMRLKARPEMVVVGVKMKMMARIERGELLHRSHPRALLAPEGLTDEASQILIKISRHDVSSSEPCYQNSGLGRC